MQAIKAEHLAELQRLSPTTVQIGIDVPNRAELTFLPGQYVNIAVPGTDVTRSYSFRNAPDEERVTFLIKLTPGGAMSGYLTERAAVGEIAGRVPVLAGCGYGTAMAKEFANAAEDSGADGILLLPPYLLNSEQSGLLAHAEAVCRSTKLGVIFYNRDNAIMDERTLEQLCERCPNLIGFKDGYGDIELMTRIYARMGDRLTYIGGLPTAETFALPYLEMGVTTYSSAIFNFMPARLATFIARSTRFSGEMRPRNAR